MRRLALFAVLSTLAVPAMALAQAAPPPPDQPAMQPPPPDQPGLQPPPPGQPGDMGPPGAPPPAHPHGHDGHDGAMMQKWHAKFDAANTSHDGHLTLQQAEAAGMKPIVAHFTAIDFHHRGYVTFNDIMAWHLDDMAKHLEHRAAELRAQD